MHAEDLPTVVGSAAKHHAPACSVNGRGFNRVVIQAPHHITDRSLIAYRQGKMDIRIRAKIFLLKMNCGFVAPAQLAAWGTQHEIGIEAGGQFLRILVVESLRAGMHCFVHIVDKNRLSGTWRSNAEPCNTAFQIDGYSELFQKIDPKDAVDCAAACFGNGAQVNCRKPNALQGVIAQGELADQDFSRVEYSCFIPGLDLDRSDMPSGE